MITFLILSVAAAPIYQGGSEPRGTSPSVQSTRAVQQERLTTVTSRPIVVTTVPVTTRSDCPSLPGAHLRDLTCPEAAALIEKLKQAQTRLRSGEQLYFDLLSGAKASDRMAKVSPRDAFIKMSFEKAFIIARVRRGKLTQSYRFAYKPAGAGQEIWDVEVLLGFSDERIFRVQMFYGRPAPF